jgi:hypothetical protein
MRVLLDFNWPINQIWKGYINPIVPLTCKKCEGTGRSPQVQYLYDKWYSFDRQDWAWCDETHTRRWNRATWNNNIDEEDVQALLEADRLWDFTRVPRTEEQREIVKQRLAEGHNSWLPFNNGYVPTPEEVNEWNRHGMGHDSLNASYVIEAKAKKRGYPPYCDVCNGDGCLWQSPEIKEAYEAWESYEPPAGEGYQLWENVTEGSPQSPVFASLDDLCNWCAENATTFADYTASAEEWRKMLEDNFVYHKMGNIIML